MLIIDKSSLSSEAYTNILNGVRFLVNDAYDNIDIPDNVIENNVFLGRFNEEVSQQVSNHASLSTYNRERLINSIQLLTAAQILFSHDRISSEDTEGERADYDKMKISEIIDEYRKQATGIINPLVPSSTLIPSLSGVFAPAFKAINPEKRF